VLGHDLDVIGEELQAAGLKQFDEAFAKLLDLVR
jgi:transaldolase